MWPITSKYNSRNKINLHTNYLTHNLTTEETSLTQTLLRYIQCQKLNSAISSVGVNEIKTIRCTNKQFIVAVLCLCVFWKPSWIIRSIYPSWYLEFRRHSREIFKLEKLKSPISEQTFNASLPFWHWRTFPAVHLGESLGEFWTDHSPDS